MLAIESGGSLGVGWGPHGVGWERRLMRLRMLSFASLLCTAAAGPTGCPYAAHLNCSRVGTVCAAFGDGGCDGAA
eukprot:SAG22_NODE_1379_length_4547_cov_8.497752_1_plen_74_part_10